MAVAQARRVPAIQQRTGQETIAALVECDLLKTQAARRVATAAVTGALHEIGAAVPQRGRVVSGWKMTKSTKARFQNASGHVLPSTRPM